MKSSDLSHPKYRADIDGLRAVAVISVVAFHVWPRIPLGGFVGVDIFFVISGYLITRIIVENMRAGRFSFGQFYSRRVNRIFPALTIVLVANLALGWFFMFPDEFRQLGKHTAAGAGFVANFVFWSEANYFDADATLKPLLHLWSLGIEEQYYLLWPAAVWLAWRLRINLVTVTLVGLAVSFLFNVYLSPTAPAAAFYSPLTRIWELLLGGLLALTTVQPPTFTKYEEPISRLLDRIVFPNGGGHHASHVRGAASATGLLLLSIAIIFIKPGFHFPGWWALIPTIGTALLIFSGPATWINRKILANPVFVWVGLISYPLYLWHWPLLSFAHIIQGPTLTGGTRIAVAIGSVVLAWLTYRLVESPIRFQKHRIAVALLLFAAIVSIGAFGFVGFANGGFASRMGDRADFARFFDGLAYDGHAHLAERAEISQNQCNFYDYASAFPTTVPRPEIDPDCYTKRTAKAVMLWGDSHAAHLYSGLKKALPPEFSLLLVFGSGCKPAHFSERAIDKNRCDKTNSFALKVAREQIPDVVILSSDGEPDVAFDREIAQTLKSYGVKRVIVLGTVPHWTRYLYKIVMRSYWPDVPRRLKAGVNTDIAAFDAKVRSQLGSNEPFIYASVFDAFCNVEGCLTYLGDNVQRGLVTFDYAHLRPAASLFVAETLIVPLIVDRLGK
jgi:peptidoglycan/LPS O-acetylase OafA/YrhL